MRGQPFSAKDKRALKWAKRLLFVGMFGYVCLMVGALSACSVVNHTVTSPPAAVRGPNHAGPNFWNERDNEKKQAACAEVVAGMARKNNATDADLDRVKWIYWSCLKGTGAAI